MSSPTSQHRFASSLDGPDSIEYQPMCRVAVAACALGVVSPLALTGHYLWVVPLLAILLAVVALWQISRSPEPLLGRNLAIMGLMAAMFFGAWALAADFAWQNRLRHEAEDKAMSWLDILRSGDTEKARELTLRYDRRGKVSSPEPASSANGNNPHRPNKIEGFLNQDATKRIREAGPEARFRPEKLLGVYHMEGADVVVLRMRMDWVHEGRAESQPLYFELARFVERQTKSAYWHVHKAELFKGKQ